MKTSEVRSTIRRKPHVVVSGKRCKRCRGHDHGEGRVGLGGRRHTKKANDISREYKVDDIKNRNERVIVKREEERRWAGLKSPFKNNKKVE